MELIGSSASMKRRKIKIEGPATQNGEEQKLWQEVERYARLIPSESEPNMGRVREIQQEIKNGTYLKPEMLEETAARLAVRFFKKTYPRP